MWNKELVVLQQKSSLVILNDVMMLETKGQSDPKAIVIVSYAMLQVLQQYTMGGILLYYG